MNIPDNLIANADDLGLNTAVNSAIARCFALGYINSASLMVNTPAFDEAVELANNNSAIRQIGVHINFAEGKPVTNFKPAAYLDANGHWDISKTQKIDLHMNNFTAQAFQQEIDAQIEKALRAKVNIGHLDSHYHLHTLPQFYKLFINSAKRYKLKLRLAQTYNEGNYLKYFYRLCINQRFKAAGVNYTERFETVDHFIAAQRTNRKQILTELMFHPAIDVSGNLTDHYQANTLPQWITYLNEKNG
jgi:chitin disaccharide deacetylase